MRLFAKVVSLMLGVFLVTTAGAAGVVGISEGSGDKDECVTWIGLGKGNQSFVAMFNAARDMCPEARVCGMAVDAGSFVSPSELLLQDFITSFVGLSYPEEMFPGAGRAFSVVANTGVRYYHLLTIKGGFKREVVLEKKPRFFGLGTSEVEKEIRLARHTVQFSEMGKYRWFGSFNDSLHVVAALDRVRGGTGMTWAEINERDREAMHTSYGQAYAVMRRLNIDAFVVEGDLEKHELSGLSWFEPVDYDLPASPKGFGHTKSPSGTTVISEQTAILGPVTYADIKTWRAVTAFRDCISDNFAKLRTTDTQWRNVERLDGVPGFREFVRPPQVRSVKKKK